MTEPASWVIAFLAGMVVMAIIVLIFQQPRYPR